MDRRALLPLPPADSGARPPGHPTALPLVGRELMLRRIARAYGHTRDGGRMLVTVVGERGSGRTRMLHEVAALAELAGSLTIELRPVAGSLDLATALERALREELVVRRSVGPMSLVDQPSAPGALAALLTEFGSVIPLVLLVDDLDEDPRGASALAETLGAVDVPWLAVVTSDTATAAATTIIGRASDARLLELYCEHFDHEATAALLRALLGEEPNSCDVAWLVEKTHGLPVLLREAIEAALRSGALVREGERIRRVDSIARAAAEYGALLPLTVPTLMTLSRSERGALATCALLGQTIPESLVAALGVTGACLERLLELRLLRRDGGTIVFESRLVHEASLADARAAALDERHAAALAELVPAAIDEGLRPPALTIDLIVRTASDDDARRDLVASLLECAARLSGSNEYYHATILMSCCYDVAVALSSDPARIGRWFEQYVTVLHALGRIDEQRRVIDEYLRRHPAETAPEELLPVVARAMLWRAEYLERSKITDTALELLDAVDDVIARVGDSDVAGALRSRALMGRARICSVADRNEEALALLRRLVDELDIETQLPIAFDALLVFGRAARTPEERIEAERRIVTMLERFEREGRERLAVQMRAARIGLHTGDDDFDLLEPEIRALLAQTRQCSLPRTETNAWVWLSMILAERGEHAEALQAIDHAIEARWRMGSIALWQLAMITRAQILVLARRDEEALATIDLVELDARTYGRPPRRFVIDALRCIVAVRRGEWQTGAAGLEELAETGRREGFEALDQMLLEAEGEILLHSHSIDREQARDYARRVLVAEPADLGALRLLPVALAIVARAHDDAGSVARGRSGASDPLVQELGRRVTEALSIWIERRAEANAEHALLLLRAHAPRALASLDLSTVDAAIPQSLAAPSWHHCDVQTLGTMRVIDAAGNERGGRHFGQHKSDSKPKKMLAALAVAAIVGRRLKRERLIDMVWGESVTAEAAVNNFHVTLSGLRQVVGDVVDFDGTSYMLNTSLVRVDALRVIAMVDEATAFQRAGLLFRTYEILREALALVGGEFLDGIYDEWTDGARDLVRARIRLARLRVAEIALARGERDIGHREIATLLEADALDEEAELLHLSLIRSDGERLRALREYDRFAERLEAEYGSEPSARLRSLRATLVADE